MSSLVYTPKTYVYKKIASSETAITLPKIEKKIAKEYRPTIIYVDKIYSGAELVDKYTEIFIDENNVKHELKEAPWETCIAFDEYNNFDNLINNIRGEDYTALDKFTDFSWDWDSLVYRLSLLGKDGATFSAYGIYFDNLGDIINVMQLGENFDLPFNEKYIKMLIKFYKHYHQQQEHLRNIPRMEVYDFNGVNTNEIC